jgi:hypothetical protein
VPPVQRTRLTRHEPGALEPRKHTANGLTADFDVGGQLFLVQRSFEQALQGDDCGMREAELSQSLVLPALDKPGGHGQQLVRPPLLCVRIRDHRLDLLSL